jgi:glycosyltransferase involved in cell wall biosynthesis
VKPKVTIGMCVKNGAATLSYAIKSVLAQDFPHKLIELIFVDDGSIDASARIIRAYADSADMTVKVFSQKWRGLGASRQLVVDVAEGDYIVWVDCDMILPTDHIRKQVEFMEGNPKVGIAKARYGILEGENAIATLENLPFVLQDLKRGLLNPKLPGTGGAIFRVEAIRQVGGFDTGLKGCGEDQDAAFRVKANGWLISRSPAIFYEKRVNTWSGLWKKWFWYGRGDRQLYRRNRHVFSLLGMSPPAGFVNGLFQIPDSYRLTHRTDLSVLLPFHSAFRMVAWCSGFAWEERRLVAGLSLY